MRRPQFWAAGASPRGGSRARLGDKSLSSARRGRGLLQEVELAVWGGAREELIEGSWSTPGSALDTTLCPFPTRCHRG